jgi:alanine or glycine:cation symporter, AGCS family
MEFIADWLETLAGLAWNYPVVILCLGAGLWFTFRLAFVQLRGFGHAILVVKGKYDKKGETGHISHLQALSAAVSGTVGLGNIAGVAIAVALGGPGAVFWMWVIGFFGMATKFVECGLGTVYREESPDGTVRGGPMYYIRKGLGESWAPLAGFFALACMISSFGGGNMFQSNQAGRVMDFYFDVPTWVTGGVLATLVGLVIIGGIKRIGRVAGILVPVMCSAYVLGGVYICIANIGDVPAAFGVIFTDAFSGEAAAGGALGTVIIWGVRRAIFSSEAGIGSAPIAHAAAKTDQPMRQGVVAILEPFIDTIVVCSITALVIVMSGYYGDDRRLVLDGADASAVATIADGDDGTRDAPEWGRMTLDGREILVALTGTAGGVARLDHAPSSVYFEDRKLNASHYRFDCRLGEGDGPLGERIVELTTFAGGPGGEVLGTARYLLSAEAPDHLPEDVVHETCPDGEHGEWHQHMLALPGAGKRDGFSAAISFEAAAVPVGLVPAWEVREPQYVVELGGIELTTTAFDTFIPGFGNYFVSIAVLLFAFSTALTWSYYGETGAAYLFGKRAVLPYKLVFIAALFSGALWSLGPVMDFSDLMMALMVVPNVLAILLLTGKVRRLTTDYFDQLRRGEFNLEAESAAEAERKVG